MKKLKSILLYSWIIFFTITQSGCFASFPLTTKLWAWNSGMGSKWVNLLLFYVLVIIPVYQVSLLGDVIIFNSIEFWTGKNPISMNDGEEESKIVMAEDRIYKITARKNQFEVEQLKGKHKGVKESLIYKPEEKAWYLKTKNKLHLLSRYKEQESTLLDQVELYRPEGEKLTISAYATKEEVERKFAVNQ